jgi:phosphate-selective porin OprO and OprP
MRLLTSCLLFLSFLAFPGSLARGQGAGPAGTTAPSSPTESASKQEVNQLRQEVAEQRQTIEQLKALVQQLVDAKTQSVSATAKAAESPQLLSATLVQGAAAQGASDQKPAEKPAEKKEAPLTAGWSGEHFYIKSSDGKFQIQPYGYVQTDYRAFTGDGSPADTFLIRRARLGFQGSYGKYYDFALLMDGVPVTGVTLRDAYVNIKPSPAFQVQLGQYKVPFAQEEIDSDANILFIERSLASLLYPDVAATFRSPGAMVQGSLYGGRMQYWAGAFNGKGLTTNNTTNYPESIGRLKLYPWKTKKESMFQGMFFAGAISYGKTRGLSGETSFSGTLPDTTFTFFPSFPINGNVWRYTGEGWWYHGPWTLSGLYVQLRQDREGVGSSQSGGLGFVTLPGITGKAGYAQASYLVTGETAVENGTPKVKRPLFGPAGPGGNGNGWGALELAFRYDRIKAKEPGVDLTNNPFTPGFVATFNNHTDAFTFGVNWHLNYWVKYMANFSVDRLQQVSINTGALPQNYFVVLQRVQFRF